MSADAGSLFKILASQHALKQQQPHNQMQAAHPPMLQHAQMPGLKPPMPMHVMPINQHMAGGNFNPALQQQQAPAMPGMPPAMGGSAYSKFGDK